MALPWLWLKNYIFPPFDIQLSEQTNLFSTFSCAPFTMSDVLGEGRGERTCLHAVGSDVEDPGGRSWLWKGVFDDPDILPREALQNLPLRRRAERGREKKATRRRKSLLCFIDFCCRGTSSVSHVYGLRESSPCSFLRARSLPGMLERCVEHIP